MRELEKKYGLKPAEREKISPDTPITKIDPNGDIKRQIANTVKMVGMRYKFQSMGEYNAILGLYNVRCDTADGRVNGREYHGLVYFATDDNGNTIATPLKASRLGKFASRTAIDGRFERAKEKIDVAPTKRKVADALGQSSGKDDFVARLKERNIDVVFRYTDEGRIYGVTFVDHDTMTALNDPASAKSFRQTLSTHVSFSKHSQRSKHRQQQLCPYLHRPTRHRRVNRHHLPELRQLQHKVNPSTATAEITTSHCGVLTCSSGAVVQSRRGRIPPPYAT